MKFGQEIQRGLLRDWILPEFDNLVEGTDHSPTGSQTRSVTVTGTFLRKRLRIVWAW